MTSDRRLPFFFAMAGIAVLSVGLAWWWIVFSEVIANNYISYGQAATCIGGNSDLCNLAQALCKTNHWLGITRYSSVIFWAGLATLSAGLVLGSSRRPV
ncbi:hypothetical protein GR212_04435 [Rhizobium lusitanum]|uniref:Vitamin K epoxide reductase family protein n=1 Tax=Rhizobium lusitanum TaxID=293958 RepID=A0A6L9TZG5_9HYPH|nr:hypothetical protein [Rhizobium lusitanum]NEI68811.1 hypothetical protein [Rhizobium lusitanum]